MVLRASVGVGLCVGAVGAGEHTVEDVVRHIDGPKRLGAKHGLDAGLITIRVVGVHVFLGVGFSARGVVGDELVGGIILVGKVGCQEVVTAGGLAEADFVEDAGQSLTEPQRYGDYLSLFPSVSQ